MKKPKLMALSLILTLSLAAAAGCTGTTQTLSGNTPAASTEESTDEAAQEDLDAAADEDATSSATADRNVPAGDGTVPQRGPGKGGRTRPGADTPSTGTDSTPSSGTVAVPDRTFTLEELAAFNGKDGKAAYIAIDGTVYDVTDAEGWTDGSHEGVSAGADLTDAFAASPHRDALLLTLTPVGTLAAAS